MHKIKEITLYIEKTYTNGKQIPETTSSCKEKDLLDEDKTHVISDDHVDAVTTTYLKN